MARTGPAPTTAASSRFSWVLAPLACAQLIIALDIYIVFVALPELGTQLGFSEQNLQWVVSAYAVAFGGFLLLGGRAADVLGRRRTFVFALGLYVLSSLVGGLAGDPTMIVAARAVQGLGGALLFPATLSLINTLFEEGRSRNRALAVWGGAGASGLTLGSLLGGVLTGAFGWEAVFFVNIPLGVAVAVVALKVIPADDRPDFQPRFDLPGALAATAGVSLLVYVLVQGPESGWTSTPIAASAIAAVALIALFLGIEARTREPLMPLRMFRNGSLRTSMAITFIFMATFGTQPYFLTLLFQQVHGFSPLQAGLAFVVQSISIAAGTQLGERLVARLDTRLTLVGGFAVGAVGTAGLAAAVSADGSYLALVPGLIVMGVGQGTAWTAMWIAAAEGVAPAETGVASGMASTTQQVGYAVGLAVLVAVANAGLDGMSGDALRSGVADGVSAAIYLTGYGIVAGAVVAAALPRQARREAALVA